jgi:hypothetical protein
MDPSQDQTTKEKEFHVTSIAPKGDEVLSVKIGPQATLLDVRAKLTEDYEEEDELPESPWSFHQGIALVGKKQEGKKRAWDLLIGNDLTLKTRKKLKSERTEKDESKQDEAPRVKQESSNPVHYVLAPAASVFNTTASTGDSSLVPDIKNEEPSPRGNNQAASMSISSLNIPSLAPTFPPVITPRTERTSSTEEAKAEEEDGCGGGNEIEDGAAVGGRGGGGNDSISEEMELNTEIESVNNCFCVSDGDFEFPNSPINPHRALEEASRCTARTLNEAKALLEVETNRQFCAKERRNKFLDQINDLLYKTKKDQHPQITIGVLGNTGV